MFRCITLTLLCFTLVNAAKAQEMKVDGDVDQLASVQKSFANLAKGFESGELTARIKNYRGMSKLRVIWRGDEAIVYLEVCESKKPVSVDEFIAKSKPLEIVFSDTETIFHFPERAVAHIYSAAFGKTLVPPDIDVIPSHFWKSGDGNRGDLARAVDPNVIGKSTERMTIEKEDSTICVTRLSKDSGGEIKLRYEIGADGLCRFASSTHSHTRFDWVRGLRSIRWETLFDGSTYLKESKSWQAMGSEPFPVVPTYSYICESISHKLPSNISFDIAALKLQDGTKLEYFNDQRVLLKSEFVGDAEKYGDLLERYGKVARLKRNALKIVAPPN